MGSKSDWETLQHADEILAKFAVPHECRVVSGAPYAGAHGP